MVRPSSGKEFGVFQKWAERFVGLDSQGDLPPLTLVAEHKKFQQVALWTRFL